MKRRAGRSLAFILCALLVFGSLPLSGLAAAEPIISKEVSVAGLYTLAAEYDLSRYIVSFTSVKRLDESGKNWEPTNKFVSGDYAKIAINYELPDGLITADNRVMEYTIPEYFTMPEDKEGDVTDTRADGSIVIVGHYTINKDTRKAVITFNDDFVQDGSAFPGSLTFEGQVTNDGTSDETIELDSNHNTIIISPYQQPDSEKYDLTVTKKGYFESADGHLYYTVTVTSEKGTAGPVTVVDTFNTDGAFHITDTVKVTDKNGAVVERKTGTMTSGWSAVRSDENDGKHTKLTLTDLPQMNAGDSYTITYQAEAPHPSQNWQYINNGVTATDGVKNSWSNATVSISRGVEKYAVDADKPIDQIVVGSHTSWHPDGTFKWAIEVNAAQVDIRGVTVVESNYWVDGQAVILNGVVQNTGLPYPTKAILYDRTDKTQTEITFAPNADGLLSYTFPQSLTDAQAHHVYEIVFDTTELSVSLGDDVKVQNQASLIYGDGTATGNSNYVVNMNNYQTKALMSTSETASTGTYGWKTTVQLRGSGAPKGTTITDTMGDLMTSSDGLLNLVVKGIKKTDTGDVSTILTAGTDFDLTVGPKTGDRFSTFTVELLREIPAAEFDRLELTYTTEVDFTQMTDGTTSNFRNTTTLTAGPNTEVDWADTPNHTKYPLMKKQGGKLNSSGQVDYTSGTVSGLDYEQINDTLYYRILLNESKTASGDLVVTDDLPQGTTLNTDSVSILYYGNDNYSYDTDYSTNPANKITDFSSFTYDAAANRATFTIKDGYPAVPIVITYTVTIDKETWYDMTVTDQTYRNSASLNGTTAAVDQEVHRDVEKLTKKGAQEPANPNLISYSLKVNPTGEDLLPNGDYITLRDHLNKRRLAAQRRSGPAFGDIQRAGLPLRSQEGGRHRRAGLLRPV